MSFYYLFFTSATREPPSRVENKVCQRRQHGTTLAKKKPSCCAGPVLQFIFFFFLYRSISPAYTLRPDMSCLFRAMRNLVSLNVNRRFYRKIVVFPEFRLRWKSLRGPRSPNFCAPTRQNGVVPTRRVLVAQLIFNPFATRESYDVVPEQFPFPSRLRT